MGKQLGGGGDVNKQQKWHERPANEWIRRGPFGTAPLGVVEDKLEVRKWMYVSFRLKVELTFVVGGFS